MKPKPPNSVRDAAHPGRVHHGPHLAGRSRLARQLKERVRFEALLADLSAAFINLPAEAIDAQVEDGLARVVAFLGVERSGFGLFSEDGKELRYTHRYVAPGFPPYPYVVFDHHLPWYTAQLRAGRLLRFERLPDDLPAEAVHEREYCTQVGMKSHVAIPVGVGGAALGAVGFASFRACRAWPDDLLQRLRLVADVFANALARKRSEEQVHQLRDQLARLGRVTMMGELAAAIAHEINQPLCAIVTNAQAAQRYLPDASGADSDLREALADIAADGERASQVIGRIRGLLQNRPPVRIALDLNEAIREVVVLVQHQLARKGIAFALDLSPDVGPVPGDRVQLQQVLLNLLLNAIEAMDQGAAGRRELTVRCRAEGRDAVVVSVCDSGPGVALEDRERVFDALFTTKAGGMGVGLAISRSIVEAHNGRIWTEPNVGTGAVFHFRLPGG